MIQKLTLNIHPEAEEDLVDYLLDLQNSSFTSYPVRGHGEHGNLSIAEQVSGRRKRMQFELLIEPDRVQAILGGLKENVGTDIVYWLQPIDAIGRIE